MGWDNNRLQVFEKELGSMELEADEFDPSWAVPSRERKETDGVGVGKGEWVAAAGQEKLLP